MQFALADRIGVTLGSIQAMSMIEFKGWIEYLAILKEQESNG